MPHLQADEPCCAGGSERLAPRLSQALGRLMGPRSGWASGGAMHTATMLWAAEYVCYIHERWCKLQEFDTYHGRYMEMRSPWWLNTLTEARLDRIPPWGTPGYAYVPADLRKARGAPNLASMCAQSQCYLLGFKTCTHRSTSA